MGFKKILKPHHNPFTVEVKLQFHKAFRVWHIYMHSSAFFVENHFSRLIFMKMKKSGIVNG